MRIPFLLFLTYFGILSLVWVIPQNTQANGWEHFAIPLETLLQVLEGDSREGRIKAAHALGIRKEKAAVEPMLKILSQPDSSPQMRSVFYTALGKIGDKRALATLSKALKSEQREELRADAASALGGVKEAESLALLLQIFKEEPTLMVRSRIVDTLGVFPQKDSIHTLIRLLQEKNTTLKRRAIRSLGRTQSSQAVQPLMDLLEQTKSKKLRIEIVDALGNIADPASAQLLTQMLQEAQSLDLRLSLVVALGAIRDGNITPVLIRLLEDPSLEVRHFAVLAIQKNHAKSAALPLKNLFLRLSEAFWQVTEKDLLATPFAILQNLELQTSILRTLTEVGPRIGLPAFLKGAAPRKFSLDSSLEFRFNDAVYELRRMALVGLGYTDEVKAVDFLLKTGPLQARDPRLRATAVRSLGVLGQSKSVEAIIAILRDDAPEVRWVSALVLGRMKDTRAIPGLREALSDSHSLVRQEAILSLGYLGDTQAQERIQRMLEKDESQRVRQAAKEFLQMQ